MKNVKKIFVLKKDNKVIKCHIIFNDLKSRDVDRKTYFKYIKELENVLNMDMQDLIDKKYVYIYHDEKKYNEVIDKIIINRDYKRSRKTLKTLEIITLISSILNIIFTNYLYTGFYVFEEMLSSFCLLNAFDTTLFLCLKNYYKEHVKPKTREFNAIAKLSIFLGISSFVNHEVPEISDSLYRFEINHTSIDDTNNYDNLNEIEARLKKTDTIFNNVHNNPSLDDIELESLYELEDFVKSNPYLDLNDVFHKLMTIRIKERYSLQTEIAGTYEEDKNQVKIYSNLKGENEIEQKQTLIHEYIHSIGDFNNRALDEGMTTLLTQDITRYPVIVYVQERTCVEYIIELIGKDALLESYSKCDINILSGYLCEVFDSYESVLELYDKMEEYCSSNISEDELVYYINNHLKSGKVELIEWTRIFGMHYNFNDEMKKLGLKCQ